VLLLLVSIIISSPLPEAVEDLLFCIDLLDVLGVVIVDAVPIVGTATSAVSILV